LGRRLPGSSRGLKTGTCRNFAQSGPTSRLGSAKAPSAVGLFDVDHDDFLPRTRTTTSRSYALRCTPRGGRGGSARGTRIGAMRPVSNMIRRQFSAFANSSGSLAPWTPSCSRRRPRLRSRERRGGSRPSRCRGQRAGALRRSSYIVTYSNRRPHERRTKQSASIPAPRSNQLLGSGTAATRVPSTSKAGRRELNGMSELRSAP
jgi:hypothetical protein